MLLSQTKCITVYKLNSHNNSVIEEYLNKSNNEDRAKKILLGEKYIEATLSLGNLRMPDYWTGRNSVHLNYKEPTVILRLIIWSCSRTSLPDRVS